jgi:hypothetical protein
MEEKSPVRSPQMSPDGAGQAQGNRSFLGYVMPRAQSAQSVARRLREVFTSTKAGALNRDALHHRSQVGNSLTVRLYR